MYETVLIEKLNYKALLVCDQVIFWTVILCSFLPSRRGVLQAPSINETLLGSPKLYLDETSK